MGWALVAALFFGLYGSMVHPLIGLIGFVAPFLLKVIRDRGRAADEAAYLEWKKRGEEEEQWRTLARLNVLEERMRTRLNEKMTDALRTFRSKIRTSPMGLKDYRSFDREIVRFLEAGMTESDFSTLRENGISLRELYEQEIGDDLHSTLEPHLTNQAHQATQFVGGSPLEFERHCANIFRACGWKVTETPASGDHGVDLIVERSGRTIAVQCKLYSQPVGNGAVQEVVAGKVHYRAHSAIVVATNGFTSGAEVLARSNAVALIHPDEIAFHFGPASPSPARPNTGRHLDWSPKRSR